MKIQIVERDKGVDESGLRRRQFANAVERGIASGDGLGDGRGDFIGVRLEGWNGDDGIELGGGFLEFRQRDSFAFGDSGKENKGRDAEANWLSLWGKAEREPDPSQLKIATR